MSKNRTRASSFDDYTLLLEIKAMHEDGPLDERPFYWNGAHEVSQLQANAIGDSPGLTGYKVDGKPLASDPTAPSLWTASFRLDDDARVPDEEPCFVVNVPHARFGVPNPTGGEPLQDYSEGSALQHALSGKCEPGSERTLYIHAVLMRRDGRMCTLMSQADNNDVSVIVSTTGDPQEPTRVAAVYFSHMQNGVAFCVELLFWEQVPAAQGYAAEGTGGGEGSDGAIAGAEAAAGHEEQMVDGDQSSAGVDGVGNFSAPQGQQAQDLQGPEVLYSTFDPRGGFSRNATPRASIRVNFGNNAESGINFPVPGNENDGEEEILSKLDNLTTWV